MNSQNVILLFLQENLQRLFQKSPFFFRIWSGFFLILVLITGVPEFIKWLTEGVLVITDIWNIKITMAVAWASRTALFMSMLSAKGTIVAKTEDGSILRQTNTDKLPFTDAQEQKIVNKMNGTLPVINNILKTETNGK